MKSWIFSSKYFFAYFYKFDYIVIMITFLRAIYFSYTPYIKRHWSKMKGASNYV